MNPIAAEPTPDSPDRRGRAGFVINPIKFTDVDAVHRDVRDICEHLGWDEPLWRETTETDPGAGQARDLLEQGCDLVVPIGGDGTVRTVASQLVGTDVALGLVPGGTGNLLVRNLDLPFISRAQALRIALTGTDRRIDVGQVRYWDVDGEAHEDVFLVMAGVGMDADVMEATDDAVKKRIGWPAYLRSALRLSREDRIPVRLRVDDEDPVGLKVRSVVFGNVGKVQGGVAVLPEARIDDGRLDTLVVSPRGITGWAGVVAAMVTRGHLGGDHASYFQSDEVDVRLSEPTRAQLDGDGIGHVTRIAGRVLPACLTVRVRNEGATSWLGTRGGSGLGWLGR
ncbi:diacylglycerol/lipid kinase family protein [Kytococcus sp. Marseille-QA3725]